MAKKRSNTSSSVGPSESDDFKLITGIGPAVEKRLNGVGIFTFAQLAALTPADIAAAVSGLAGLTAERVIKQDWIGQAHKLVVQSTSSEPDWIEHARQLSANGTVTRQKGAAGIPVESQHVALVTNELQENLVVEVQKDVEAPTNPQHIATFAVELVLNEDNEVLGTELVHIQSRNKESWVGWQASRLVSFLVRQAEVSLPPVESTSTITEEKAALTGIKGSDSTADVVEEETVLVGIGSAGIVPPVEKEAPIGMLHLCEMKTVPAGADSPRSLLSYGQPFDVYLTLDFTDVLILGDAPLSYTASIHAKKLDDRARQPVGAAHGTIMPSDKASIRVEGTTLAQGMYRLEATVTLTLESEESSSHSDLTALIKGGVLQVY